MMSGDRHFGVVGAGVGLSRWAFHKNPDSGSVIPAKAGIQAEAWGSILDSGLRRNDEWEDRSVVLESCRDV
jgi:hypothetical protein